MIWRLDRSVRHYVIGQSEILIRSTSWSVPDNLELFLLFKSYPIFNCSSSRYERMYNEQFYFFLILCDIQHYFCFVLNVFVRHEKHFLPRIARSMLLDLIQWKLSDWKKLGWQMQNVKNVTPIASIGKLTWFIQPLAHEKFFLFLHIFCMLYCGEFAIIKLMFLWYLEFILRINLTTFFSRISEHVEIITLHVDINKSESHNYDLSGFFTFSLQKWL